MKDSISGLTTVESRLCGYLRSETIFNINHRALADTEFHVLGKG